MNVLLVGFADVVDPKHVGEPVPRVGKPYPRSQNPCIIGVAPQLETLAPAKIVVGLYGRIACQTSPVSKHRNHEG